MTRKKILITGAGGVGTLSIYNELKNRYDFYFSDNNLENIHPKIPRKKCFHVPLAKDKKAFEKKISLIIKKYRIDLIIPTVDEELIFFSKKFASNSLVPQYEFVKIFNNKFLTFKSLLENKILQPTFVNKKSIKNKKIFPLIAKPIFGRGSSGIIKINNYNEYFYLKKIKYFDDKNYITQKFVNGIEYSVQMIANKNGDLISIIPVKIIEKKGITIKALVSNNNKIIKLCKKFHNIYRPNNIYNIQLIMNKNGVYIIEINPRISTTHILTLKNGINPIKIFFSKYNLKFENKNLKKLNLNRYHETYIVNK